MPDGSINGLDLSSGRSLIVRDYDGDAGTFNYHYNSTYITDHTPPVYHTAHGPIAITVQTGMDMGTDGVMKMIFEDDPWDSLISFSPGIAVTLGGTLDLTFADGVDLSSQVGRTFKLFDWTGASPTGAFNIDSPYTWDLSNLYSTGSNMGEVTLLAMPEPSTIWLLAMGLLSFCAYRSLVHKHQ
jgi:hypothetical protein